MFLVERERGDTGESFTYTVLVYDMVFITSDGESRILYTCMLPFIHSTSTGACFGICASWKKRTRGRRIGLRRGEVRIKMFMATASYKYMYGRLRHVSNESLSNPAGNKLPVPETHFQSHPEFYLSIFFIL